MAGFLMATRTNTEAKEHSPSRGESVRSLVSCSLNAFAGVRTRSFGEKFKTFLLTRVSDSRP